MRSLGLRGRPRRLHPLRYGWEPIPEAVSLRGGSPDEFLLEPVTGAAIAFDEGWVLVDTGFNIDTIRDDAKRLAHYVIPNYTAVVPGGDPLVDQLRALGLGWDSLAACVVSHLHCDHSGGLRHLVDGPPIVIQGAELEFGMSSATLQDAYFRSDYDLPGLDWELVEGDEELADGLRLIPTRGHTPGHTSVAIDLAETGTVVLACDAADLKRNIDERIAPGTTTSPELEDAAQTTIDLLHGLDQTDGTQVWPGHDPEFWVGRMLDPGNPFT
jgi:N-acyl homoserine lactone hydrolase